MEVFECLKARRTVRQFRPDPVPRETITRLLQACRWAPSSRNQQPWHLIVIQDRETLAGIGAIATSGSFVSDAPLAIALVMENADAPEIDGGRALQQMEIMAWSEGLGTCFVGLPTEEQHRKVKALLNIPAEMDLITVLPFGYRQEDFKGKGVPRKPLSAMAHDGRFGQGW